MKSQENNFKINKLFRVMTKDKILKEKTLNIKGRKFILKNFYDHQDFYSKFA